MEDIVNRIANSSLITIDLEDYYPAGERTVLDIKDWLYEGLILKEKEFRNTLKNFDWQQFKNHHIALCCSSEAIIPAWAFLLIQTHLHGIAKTVVFGTLEILETVLYTTIIENLDVSVYKDKPVIVKGCSDKAVPQNAYLLLSKKLQGVARSI